MNRETATSFIYLVITYFLWGSMYVFSCMLSSDIPEIVAAAVRCGIGLFPMLFMGRKELKEVRVKKGDWKYFLIIGISGYYLCIMLTQIGTVRAGSSLSFYWWSISCSVCGAQRRNKDTVIFFLLSLPLFIGYR